MLRGEKLNLAFVTSAVEIALFQTQLQDESMAKKGS
jgi:hypothetical protein